MHDDSLRRCAERLSISCADLQPELTLARVIDAITQAAAPSPNGGKPRGRGRPSARDKQLQRAYFIEPLRRQKFAGRYWGAKEGIQRVIRLHPNLWPGQTRDSKNPPYKAVQSSHNKWHDQAEEDDHHWQKKLKKEWRQFTAPLDDHTHDLVLALVALLRAMHEPCRDDERKSVSVWHDWLAICERALPPDTFVRLIETATLPSVQQLLAGYALSEQRKPYERK